MTIIFYLTLMPISFFSYLLWSIICDYASSVYDWLSIISCYKVFFCIKSHLSALQTITLEKNNFQFYSLNNWHPDQPNILCFSLFFFSFWFLLGFQLLSFLISLISWCRKQINQSKSFKSFKWILWISSFKSQCFRNC